MATILRFLKFFSHTKFGRLRAGCAKRRWALHGGGAAGAAPRTGGAPKGFILGRRACLAFLFFPAAPPRFDALQPPASQAANVRRTKHNIMRGADAEVLGSMITEVRAHPP